MMEHPGWAVLVDWLGERMRPVKLAVLNGNIENHDDYLKKTHWLRGITDAIDSPQDIAQLLVNEQGRRKEKA